MSWMDEHVLLLYEMIVRYPFTHKSGSREMQSCWNPIAVTLNFKDQPIRDHFKKILNASKRNLVVLQLY